jgi:hypothetical protein
MFKQILQNTTDSIKQNIKPGIVLWGLALTLVILYYRHEPSRNFFDFFGNLKTRHGIVYGILSTTLFAGVIPYLYLLLTKSIKKNYLPELLFYIFFWASKGAEVDLFYTQQSVWFGNTADTWVIIRKTVIDQFVFTVVWVAPTIAIFYEWKNVGFKFVLLKNSLNKSFLKTQLPTIIFANWIVWIPTVSIIYILPLQLQLPIANIVLCFWVLLLAILNKNKSENE